MKKLPFILMRLLATVIVVSVFLFIFTLKPIYLTVIGIISYAAFDFFGYAAFSFVKKRFSLKPRGTAPPRGGKTAPTKGGKTAPTKGGKKAGNGLIEANIEDFLSLNRRLDFIIYFDAPASSEHQVLMWIPFLSALRRNYVIVLRNESYRKLFMKYGLPVVVLSNLKELVRVVDAGVKSVFYVNNGMRNTHMVRYNELTHIQLLHGDSDKPASYNPISVMYDYLFVAGEMAIDRYTNNNVDIPHKKYVIVGRPQTEELIKLSSKAALSEKVLKTILYTTTWSGFQEETNFSSILQAEKIVRRAVDMGFRVIFRPHPNSYKDKQQETVINSIADFLQENAAVSGVGHCVSNSKKFGFQYKTPKSCMNAADLLISDVSSMISDWLYSAKPYLMVDRHKDKDAFMANNPLAKAGYYLDTGLSELEETLSLAISEDPMWDERLKTREYALGISINDDPLEKFVTATNLLLDKIQHFNDDNFNHEV